MSTTIKGLTVGRRVSRGAVVDGSRESQSIEQSALFNIRKKKVKRNVKMKKGVKRSVVGVLGGWMVYVWFAVLDLAFALRFTLFVIHIQVVKFVI